MPTDRRTPDPDAQEKETADRAEREDPESDDYDPDALETLRQLRSIDGLRRRDDDAPPTTSIGTWKAGIAAAVAHPTRQTVLEAIDPDLNLHDLEGGEELEEQIAAAVLALVQEARSHGRVRDVASQLRGRLFMARALLGNVEEFLAALDDDCDDPELRAEIVALRAAMAPHLGQACNVCGCTELDACKGGCSWAAPSLCSTCAGDHPAAPNGNGWRLLRRV